MAPSVAFRPVVSWGELLWDLFLDGPRLGGCAGNVAYHVAQLEGRSVLVSRVGDDELGRRAARWLSQHGVGVECVQVDRDRGTGTVRVDVSEGEPRFSIVQQAAWDRIEWTPLVQSAVRDARTFVFGTLAQRTPLGSGALRHAVRSLPDDCVRLCDLNVRPPFDDPDVIDSSLRLADAVKLNETEAERLQSVFGVTDAVSWLLDDRNVRLVALTRGARGSLLASRDERVEHPGVPKAEGGDSVGAGDAFAAVLASRWARTPDLRAVSEAANHYASYVASQPGAMPAIPRGLLKQMPSD